jgi:hypothetical protein
MKISQNGWPVLEVDSKRLHKWIIPAKNGRTHFVERNGSAGFLLAYLALWFAEVIEPLKGKIWDEWGHAYRPIRGQNSGFSNHASGTAEDFNAIEHPLARTGTYKRKQYRQIHRFLRGRLKGSVRWGADYNGRKDEMHFEIVQSLGFCERRARFLMKYTWRGRRIIKANPSQKKIINS